MRKHHHSCTVCVLLFHPGFFFLCFAHNSCVTTKDFIKLQLAGAGAPLLIMLGQKMFTPLLFGSEKSSSRAVWFITTPRKRRGCCKGLDGGCALFNYLADDHRKSARRGNEIIFTPQKEFPLWSILGAGVGWQPKLTNGDHNVPAILRGSLGV